MSRVAAQYDAVPELDGLGRRILERRITLGMSRRELATDSGLSEQHLLTVEKGLRKKISVETLIRLCKGLQMSADALLDLSSYAGR